MGTINYGTGDVVTLGLDVRGDVEEDYGCNGVELMYNYINHKISGHFAWFNFNLDDGYYEGFYLAINKNYSTDKELEREVREDIIKQEVADMWRLTDEEKKDIKVEAEVLRTILKDLLTDTFVVCFPSWCTGYCDAETSKTEIDKAIDKVINEL